MTTQQNNNLDDGAANIPANLGAVPASMKASLKVVDPTANIPCLVPGKPGFEIGKTLAGYYQRTNRIFSDKFTAGKTDAATGKNCRDQHIFKDANGLVFGIWSVGSLGYVLPKLAANTFVAITYDGVAEKALKAGQNPPHEFTYQGVGGLDLSGQVDSSHL